ncbi:MAG: 30S ribosomal protein S12 methylthiotransferase RimO [Firmicutes bacterium]|jgi:ribosomal protein S12 methylthiotransferase|nr:30S ribosomal protein S12 methylthiotransferase RimO [Bacillota bacterium]
MTVKVGLVSLGCAKNLVDSEIALGYLHEDGYEIVNHPEQADVLIVNTCGFIGPAKEESINTIFEMADYKQTGRCRCLIVTGCLSKRYQQELWDEIPEIDAVLGTGEMDALPQVIRRALAGERVSLVREDYFSYDDPRMPRLISTGRHSAYLKIAEGCGHSCAFCAIPHIRGPYRSRSPKAILAEAEELAAVGVKELNIVAQDTTQYGRDLAPRQSLASLLRELVQLDIPWIRILYAYPTAISQELLDLMSAHDNLLSYIDLPLQHASRSVLKRMLRPGSYDSYLKLLEQIRSSVPQVTIRSSFIVGYPGETEAEFQTLLDFLKAAQLDRCGIFMFSPEEGTPAYDLQPQVDEETKEERYRMAMELQQQISLGKQKKLLGKTLEVLVEGRSEESDLVLVGRHRGQAPEVDGLVYMGNPTVEVGSLVKVKITQVHPYDLVGEMIEGDVE